ncbi:MAG TPA: DUF72 domain-containing protein [Dehalococcoidia bacterium]|nr:DUF72 domain-containing protein [Dehalococcoidia bacterium]
MTARIYLGTSSWADEGLVKSGFYPSELRDTAERLAFFAKHFDLAEIDSTYYALPSRKNFERWAAAVPDGFRFAVKAMALFTQHPTRMSAIPASFRERLPAEIAKRARVYYKDVPQEVRAELWAIFLRAVDLLREAGKLAAVLMDFPPWFVPSTANRALLAETREFLAGYPVIVEFRNRLWLEDDASAKATFDCLREFGYGFCAVDEPPGLASSMPPIAKATAAIGSVRFRGRNAANWERKGASMEERLDWTYSREELEEWLPRIERLAAATEQLFLVFNTKAGGQSVSNARLMQELLGVSVRAER